MYTVKNTISIVKQNIEYHSNRSQDLRVIGLNTRWRYPNLFLIWKKDGTNTSEDWCKLMFAMAVLWNTSSRIYLYPAIVLKDIISTI